MRYKHAENPAFIHEKMRWLHGTIVSFALLCIVGIGFMIQSTLVEMHMEVDAAIVIGIAAVYLVTLLWDWSISPPSPQRGAYHALVLSMFWWLCAICLVVAEQHAGNVRKQWFRNAVAMGMLALVVSVATMCRMGIDDYQGFLKRLERRRRRAAQGHLPRNPVSASIITSE